MHDYLVAILGGVGSGLIVALVLAIFRIMDKPPFEATAGPDSTVTIINNRLRPAVIGGTWMMCEGSVVSERSPRGENHGILLRPRVPTVLERSQHLAPGQTFVMTIRYIPLWRHLSRKLPSDHLHWQMDPTALVTNGNEHHQRKWHRFPIILKSA